MTAVRRFVVGEVILCQDDPLSVDRTMCPEPPTATKVLFPKVTPRSGFVVELSIVALLKDDPLSVDLTTFPDSPTATNIPGDELIVNEVIVRGLLTFPEESVTVIVQSEKVPSKALYVIVLLPVVADIVLEEQEPPYVIVPASSEEKV